MKWFFIFCVSFLLITIKNQACQNPEDTVVLKEAGIIVAARSDKGYNKMLVRAKSCELPTLVDDKRGRRVALDIKRLEQNENPLAVYPNGYIHPGRKLIGRAGGDSPKGSPRDPSKLQQSVTEDYFSEEEDGSPIFIAQRRATFSE